MRLFPASITLEQEGGFDEVRLEAMERGEENAIVRENQHSPQQRPISLSRAMSRRGWVSVLTKGRFRVRTRTLYAMTAAVL